MMTTTPMVISVRMGPHTLSTRIYTGFGFPTPPKVGAATTTVAVAISRAAIAPSFLMTLRWMRVMTETDMK
jgi:hypothetical protein